MAFLDKDLMILSRPLFSIAILSGTLLLPENLAAEKRMSTSKALQYFQEADAASRADGGRLWGVPLGGGLLLLNPETRIAYAGILEVTSD
ncbi:MAG: hypothetical protein ABIR38_05140 [Chthoniobacterales bacterium]